MLLKSDKNILKKPLNYYPSVHYVNSFFYWNTYILQLARKGLKICFLFLGKSDFFKGDLKQLFSAGNLRLKNNRFSCVGGGANQQM